MTDSDSEYGSSDVSDGVSDSEGDFFVQELNLPRNVSTSQCTFCSGSVARNDSLCDQCQGYNDGRHIFYCSATLWDYQQHDDLSEALYSSEQLTDRRNCIVCQYFRHALLERWNSSGAGTHDLPKLILDGGPYSLQAQDREQQFHLSELEKDDHIGATSIKCVIVVLVIEDEDTLPDTLGPSRLNHPQKWSNIIELQTTLHYSHGHTRLVAIDRWESPVMDMSICRSWVEKCASEHDHGDDDTGSHVPTDFRLIDVQLMRIFEPEHAVRYVALSYAWKAAEGEKLVFLERDLVHHFGKEGSLDEHQFPAIISDAIVWTRQIGQRFLWIDRLCIIQDDYSVMISQINAMDQIYTDAYFTLVAAADQNLDIGMPGITTRPRASSLCRARRFLSPERRLLESSIDRRILGSYWNSRAWTFQERLLSPRCLYIFNNDVAFMCSEGVYEEDLGALPDDARLLKPSIRPLADWAPQALGDKSPDAVSDYRSLVTSYLSRSLSYSTDVLNAFAGVSKVLERQLGTRILSGLPERYLLPTICWGPFRSGMQRRTDMPIPTWSWAAWIGHSDFFSLGIAPLQVNTIGYLTQFHFVDANGVLTEVDVDNRWFGNPMSFRDFEDSDSLEVPLQWLPENREEYHPKLGDSDAAWRSCPQNPWTVRGHSKLPPEVERTASSYPGALIFNTTAATLRLRYKTRTARPEWKHESPWFPQVLLDIYDSSGQTVGRLMRMREEWVESFLNLDDVHEFIVLGAAMLPVNSASFQSANDGPLGGDYGSTYNDPTWSPWLLLVMLIERDSTVAHLCRRVAIGRIEMRCWKRCNPQLESIILM